ncbi:PAS domain S-box protein [Hymenobacter sp. 102]|uniref:PAS domain S-box protein n=1 Tax=Hymenobacter sp. 102 TaxID=3403152 RepID=UPI003CF1B90D
MAALPWGVLLLDAQYNVRYVNSTAAQWGGVAPEALIGCRLTEAPLAPALRTALHHLLVVGEAQPDDTWLPHTQQWASLRLGPAPAGQYWVFWEDTTARQRSRQLLLNMEAIAHIGSYEVDLATGKCYFSDGMYRLFGEEPQRFELSLPVIDTRSHPDDVAAVAQVLAEAIRTRQPYTYRRRICRADGQWRTLEAHGEVCCDAAGTAEQLRGLVQDITERVQAEQQQRENHALLQRTVDSSLDLVQVFAAVRDEQGQVVDFTWVLNNAAAEREYGNVIGQRLCVLNPGVVETGIFDTFRQVLESGVPDQSERHYTHEQFDGWFYQSVVKLGDGVATTTHDITARKRAEQELRENRALLQDVIDAPHIGLAVYRAVRDEAGDIVNFVHEYINRASREMLGEDFTGKLFTDHGDNGRHQLAQLCQALVSGQRNRYLRPADFRGRAMWFAITNTPLDRDRLVHSWEDVTERQQAQLEILQLKEELAQQVSDKYQALFHSMDQGFGILEVLFDETGEQALDFRYQELNPVFVRESGMPADAQGRTARELLPNLEAFWFESYGRVARTGEPLRVEHFEPIVGRWFDVHAFRIGPPATRQVAVLFSDVTARKRAQQRQQFLLQLADVLRPLTDPQVVQHEALAVLRAHLGSTQALYAEALTQEGILRISAENRAPNRPSLVGQVLHLQALGPGALTKARAGQPHWCSDALTATHTREHQDWYAALGTPRAWVMIPLVKKDQLLAMVVVADAMPRTWPTEDVTLLQEAIERIWAAVERVRAEAVLAASEEKYRTLFETMDEGFAIVEVLADDSGQVTDMIWREMNPGVERHVGLSGWAGRKASEVMPGVEQEWLTALTSVYQTGKPVRTEAYMLGLNRWIDTYYTRVGDTSGRLIALVFNDITERKRREQQHEFLLQLSDALRPLSHPLDIHATAAKLLGRQLSASRAYYVDLDHDAQEFVVAPDWHDADIAGPGRRYPFSIWPMPWLLRGQTWVCPDIATSPDLSEEQRALYHSQNIRAAVIVPLTKQAQLTATLVIGHNTPHAWCPQEVTLLEEAAERIWGAVERARVEESLRESEATLAAVFDALPVGIGLNAADGRQTLANHQMRRYLPIDTIPSCATTELPRWQAMGPDGHPLPASEFPGARAQRGEKVMSGLEMRYTPAEGQLIWTQVFAAPLRDRHDQVTGYVTAILDITARKQAEEALRQSEEEFRMVANLVPDLLWRSNAAGETRWYNQRWYEYTGQTPVEAAGYGWTDVIHPDDRVASVQRYRAAMQSGQPLQQEHRIRSATGEYHWFLVQALAIYDEHGAMVECFGAATDIHSRKLAEVAMAADQAGLAREVAARTHELQASRDLLQSVLDTSLISMSVLYAVRDEKGQVQDFRIGLVNKELERETGRTDMVGKLYTQEYSGIRQTGIFDLILRALETDEPQGVEYLYPFDGSDKWYACQFVKLGDGVVATNLNITQRKIAEQERLKNLRLLEQAEAVAGLGSWDYDLVTGHMRWSEGMYHLVHLPPGQPVGPDVYLQLVVEEDRARAEQLVRRLTTGQNVEHTLRLRVDGQVKTVRIKAVVLRDETGFPARVLGVDLDLTELQRLEADNLRLRLTQQRALFEAVQATQEAERRRMAESLHNGIGQILCATKLRLDQVHASLAGTSPTLATARAEADQLLSEAIRQTRALSHELVPMVLEKFGLAAALQDIANKMSTPPLRMLSHVELDESAVALTPSLQMAVYRMAQELAQNIAKHARGATQASLELESMLGWVLLRAEDNGSGFSGTPTEQTGLGLRSIRDQVALLGGQLEIGSVISGGAYVRIRIPYPGSHPDSSLYDPPLSG